MTASEYRRAAYSIRTEAHRWSALGRDRDEIRAMRKIAVAYMARARRIEARAEGDTLETLDDTGYCASVSDGTVTA